MSAALRHYLTITAGYWAFTLTDGAIRMLVVLYFHQLGYSPFEVAMLFLFYEFFGIVTNMLGGWLGARTGLKTTLHLGMGLQVFALLMLSVPAEYLSVAYVMLAQALSGIAKDLNKMSAKAGVKSLLPQTADARLFKWVALLTGSKNALKGVGFFFGAALLQWLGFQSALWVLAGGLALVMLFTLFGLPRDLGKSKSKPKFAQLFAKSAQINWLSAARFFLFGARDVWFVVALPVFLYSVLGWAFSQVGAFFALWVMGYGMVQAYAPRLLRKREVGGAAARNWAFVLMLCPAGMALALQQGWDAATVVISGLALFGVLFAINSALHSFLIVSWSDVDKVATNVGFYYMANAGGRLTGTVLSGWVYQWGGLEACLWLSAEFVLMAGLLASPLVENLATDEHG